jgi:hypothetical protein
MSTLPPCGLYRTSQPLGDAVAAGRLVLFHNHGEPGPGVYLPSAWAKNKASFHAQGTPIPEPSWALGLEPLLPEGFYRVEEPFVCCEKGCVSYEPGMLVQLGYDGGARPLLFLPAFSASGLELPERGAAVDPKDLRRCSPLKVHGTGGSAPFH